MAKELPQFYKLKFLDAEGQEVGIHNDLINLPLREDVEREVQFMAMAKNAGHSVVDYSVHLMRPEEVKAHLRAEKRQRIIDSCNNFFGEVIESIGERAHIDVGGYLESAQQLQMIESPEMPSPL